LQHYTEETGATALTETRPKIIVRTNHFNTQSPLETTETGGAHQSLIRLLVVIYL